MRYSIIGPEVIARDVHGSILGKQQALWEAFEERREGVADGCGCYVFAVRAGKGFKPWYVGKAEKQSFRKECFGSHKLAIYRGLANRYRRGTPILFLAVRETPKQRLCRPTRNGYRDVDFLEMILIGQSLRANPELCNIKDTQMLREMIVPGLINGRQGQPSKSEMAFRRLLNL